MILRDLSDLCFGLQPNTDCASANLAVGQEVIAFSPPKFSLKKSHLRDKRHFGLSRDASVQFVNLTRDVLLVTLLLQCNDVSLNPGPPVKLSVENFTRSRGLKIAHLNVRSLMPKLDSLKILFENKPFDVFTVSETWLKPSILDNEIHLPGYSCVRSDRLGKVGGGCLAYVRDGIPYRPRPDLGTSSTESCVVEISRPKCKRLLIWTIYRAPDLNMESFVQDLDTSLSALPDNIELILLGDLNVNFTGSNLNIDKTMKRKLIQVTNSHELDQLINKPTRITERSSTLIDLLFSNTTHRVTDH